MPPPLPTKHSRKTLALPDEQWAAIDAYRHRERIGTEVEAVRRLVDAGLRAEACERRGYRVMRRSEWEAANG